MGAGVDEGVPIGLFRHVLAFEEAQDHVQRLRHAVALGVWVYAQHQRVGGQQARPGAEHHTTAGVVIQLDHPVRGHQRVVVGQRDHAGAELDPPGALCRNRNEQFG